MLVADRKLTGNGPSSNALAKKPEGASHMSPGILHLYVEEQTWGPLGSNPWGYTGFVLGVFELTGIFGIFPAVTAAFKASTHAFGS